jgi:hypothetical protein
MNSRILFGKSALAAVLMTIWATAVLAQPNYVRGSLSGHDVGVFYGPTRIAAGSTEGIMSGFGRFTCTLLAIIDPATRNAVGTFVLAFSNGDVIYGSYVGHGDFTPTQAHIVEQLSIKGGTGRLHGATGSLTFDRVGDLSTQPNFGSTSGTVTGTINTPSK